MKRKAMLLLLLLPVLPAIGQQHAGILEEQKVVTLEEAVTALVRGMNEALPEAKVAVISIDSPASEVSEDIMKTINVAITQTNLRTKKITRVERTALDKVYDELDFQTSRSVDQATAKRIGGLVGAEFVIYGSYKPQAEGLFALYLCAAHVETGDVIWEDIKKRVRVRAKPGASRPDAWENSRFSLGLRVGASPRFYELSEDIPSGVPDTGVSFEGALQAGVYLFSFFTIETGLRTEILFAMDRVSYGGRDGRGEFTASFKSSTLEIPLLLSFSRRFSRRFILSLFAGPSFSLPLGKLDYAGGGEGASYRFRVPPGWLAGFSPGFRLGPGTLFADLRYRGDSGNTSLRDGGGVLSVYSRSRGSFTLGYEFGLARR
jgi:hypothetical protein